MYVPAVANVRAADWLVVTAVMFAGAPAGALSKKTLCPSEPNSNVTVPPIASTTDGGVNRSAGVACTVAAATGAVPGSTGPVGPSDPYPSPPHAAAKKAAAAARPRTWSYRLWKWMNGRCASCMSSSSRSDRDESEGSADDERRQTADLPVWMTAYSKRSGHRRHAFDQWRRHQVPHVIVSVENCFRRPSSSADWR